MPEGLARVNPATPAIFFGAMCLRCVALLYVIPVFSNSPSKGSYRVLENDGVYG